MATSHYQICCLSVCGRILEDIDCKLERLIPQLKNLLFIVGNMTILMHLPRRRSGARLGDGLSAVVWSLAESCRREDEPLERVCRVMDTPLCRVPLQFEQFIMTLLYE